MAFYDISVKDAKGESVSIGELAKDKVALVINVASGCSFTPQYSWIQEMYESILY